MQPKPELYLSQRHNAPQRMLLDSLDICANMKEGNKEMFTSAQHRHRALTFVSTYQTSHQLLVGVVVCHLQMEDHGQQFLATQALQLCSLVRIHVQRCWHYFSLVPVERMKLNFSDVLNASNDFVSLVRFKTKSKRKSLSYQSVERSTIWTIFLRAGTTLKKMFSFVIRSTKFKLNESNGKTHRYV